MTFSYILALSHAHIFTSQFCASHFPHFSAKRCNAFSCRCQILWISFNSCPDFNFIAQQIQNIFVSSNNFMSLKKEFVFDRAIAGFFARFLLHLFALFSQNREAVSFVFVKSGGRLICFREIGRPSDSSGSLCFFFTVGAGCVRRTSFGSSVSVPHAAVP